MAYFKISKNCIKRLTQYLLFVNRLEDEGEIYITSQRLGCMMDISASLIRQDLGHLGSFGEMGCGYNLKRLKEAISKALKVDAQHRLILIGSGSYDQLVESFFSKDRYGFSLVAVFDDNEKSAKHMQEFNIPIMSKQRLESYLQNNQVDAAALCTSDRNINALVGQLLDNGVKTIWNFTNTSIQVRQNDVHVEEINLERSLLHMSYYMAN